MIRDTTFRLVGPAALGAASAGRERPYAPSVPDGALPLVALAADRPAVPVRLVGELDLATAPLLESVVSEQVGAYGLDVHLDLSELTFCDVAGVRTLLRCAQRLSAAGGRLTLLAPRPRPLLLRMAEAMDVTAALRWAPPAPTGQEGTWPATGTRCAGQPQRHVAGYAP